MKSLGMPGNFSLHDFIVFSRPIFGYVVLVMLADTLVKAVRVYLRRDR